MGECHFLLPLSWCNFQLPYPLHACYPLLHLAIVDKKTRLIGEVNHKNKLHELIMFHKGRQGGGQPPSLILEIYLVIHFTN